jgi:uncharacterized membrane protein YjfL (UPF0719 family)
MSLHSTHIQPLSEAESELINAGNPVVTLSVTAVVVGVAVSLASDYVSGFIDGFCTGKSK